jgi:endoglucanase Acf2/fibronectin type 3 domain-containing protein
MKRKLLFSLLALGTLAVPLGWATPAIAQTAISAGSGSYASSLPTSGVPGDDGFYGPSISNMLGYYNNNTLYISPSLKTKAIPTNKWWTDLIFSVRNQGGSSWVQQPLTSSLWVYPQIVAPTASGMWMFYPAGFESRPITGPVSYVDAGPYMEVDALTNGHTFAATNPVVTAYGDWTVTYSESDSTSNGSFTTTLARGVPFVWVQYSNTNPEIKLNGNPIYDSNGNQINTNVSSFTASSVAYVSGGKTFGIFAPPGTTFNVSGDYIIPQLGASGYVVYGVLPDTAHLSEFATYAYAMPTGSQMTYTYDRANGKIVTNWSLTTTALTGTNTSTLQGWLPHHYHNTVNNFSFKSYTYMTPRGTMQIAPGNSWQITYPFRGISPILPAPHTNGLSNDYQSSRMQNYVTQYVGPGNGNHPIYVAETYGEGKELALAAQVMTMADQLGMSTAKTTLLNGEETLLDNWYTYTPGESSEYFGLLGNYGGLIGVPMSFGTAAFNDNHFHYGYFALASALTGMEDPTWLQNYGPMVTLIAKEYANWDRTDTSFPYLRVFDAWEGHSWASGYSGQFGENQESSSESMNAWAGLFLLGNMLGNQQMADAGAMGWTLESYSTNEYWQDWKHTNFPAGYGLNGVGIVAAGQIQYQNNFSSDPAWNYAIQMVPVQHWSNYLDRDPNFAQQYLYSVFPERALMAQNNVAGFGLPDANNDWPVFGNYPGDFFLGMQELYDPNTVATEFDNYYAANDTIATTTNPPAANSGFPGSVYYILHTLRGIGLQDLSYYTNIPTSAVYYSSTTGVRTAVIYNPQSTSQTATVYNNGTQVTTVTCAAHQLTTATVGGSAPMGLPSAPTNVAVTGSGTSATVTWSSVAGATSYNVYRATSSASGSYFFTGITGTSFTDTGLVADGHKYAYTVFAVNGAGMGSASSTASNAPSVRLYGSGVQTVTDYMYDLTGPTSLTSGWASDGGNMGNFGGDDGRAERAYQHDDVESMVYSYPNITAFTANVWMLKGPESTVVFYTSVDNGATFQSMPVTWTGPAPNGSTWTDEIATPTNPLPAGCTNIKIEFDPGTGNNWDPELGQVTFTYGSASGSPSTPIGLSATAGNSQVTLTWNAVSGATSYNVYRSTTPGGEGSTPIASGLTGATYTNTGLTNGTKYYYTVAAVNSSGTSAQSSEVNATPQLPMPGVPTGVAATAGNAQVSLSWTASANATSYNVYRSSTSGGEGSTPVATGITGTTYTNTGLTNGTKYYFTIAAVNSAGTSAQSTEVNATPAGSSSQTITDYLNDWTIISSKSANWTLDGSNVSYFAGDTSRATRTVDDTEYLTYTFSGITTFNAMVYTWNGPVTVATFWYSTNNGSTWTQCTVNYGTKTAVASGWGYYNVVPSATLPAAVTNLKVQFTSGTGNGWDPQLSQISITYGGSGSGGTAPSTPTGLSATAGNAQVSLSWSASSGATSYNVYRSSTSGGEGTTPIATGLTGTNYTNTGLTNGTKYYFTVAAVNAAGTSAQSTEASATPQLPLPGTPTGLTATSGNAQVALTWTASSNAASYNVYRGTTAGGESATPVATGITSTSYTDTGLTNGTTYYYKVAAVNSTGTSAQSTEATATPAGSTGTSGPVSINCGGSASSPFVADVDFSGGTTGSTTSTIATPFVSTPIPPQAVLQSWRTGTFTYTLPGFTAGTGHTVQLYFMDPTSTANGQRNFNVSINGSQALTNFDVYAAAQGQYRAIQENFNATANTSGQIVISFTAGTAGQPIVEGITVPN